MRIRSSRALAITSATLAALLVAGVASAHDLFLRAQQWFVPVNGRVELDVLNGTFSTSENGVTRDRLVDLAVVGPEGRAHGDTALWIATARQSHWMVPVGAAATYVFGASTRPRTISLDAKAFNAYLADDGIPDVLAARKASRELKKPARERYAKHIKALVQVGDVTEGKVDVPLGYPAELVALDNPYAPGVAQKGIRVKALVDGEPVPNQTVLAGGRTPTGARLREQRVTTDAQGIARIVPSAKGAWYVKFIRMVKIPASAHDSVDYESKWASLTFGVR